MKENPDVRRYLEKKEWVLDETKDQSNIYIQACPFCGDGNFHFHINKITGQTNCWKCEGASGPW